MAGFSLSLPTGVVPACFVSAILILRVLTLGAETPEGHLCLVENESVGLRGLQAGRLTEGTVHVGGAPATAGDDVVMVVAHAHLVSSRRAGGGAPPGPMGDEGG